MWSKTGKYGHVVLIRGGGKTLNRRVIVCYYGSWAHYRQDIGKCDPADLDPNRCTHLIYTFAGLDGNNFQIKSLDPPLDLPPPVGLGKYDEFVGLKKRNPSLKTLLAVGGASNDPSAFSNMVSSPQTRKTFVDSALAFVTKHGFDGLDVDWESPAQGGGRPSDKDNFFKLLRELQAAFKPEGLLLTVAIGAGKWTIDTSFDIPGISSHVDHIHVMNYDYHGSWEGVTGHVAPIYSRPNDPYLNVDFTMTYLLSLGAPANKLVLGMPVYARTFTLVNPDEFRIGAPAAGPGLNGTYTQTTGVLGYFEMCKEFATGGWATYRDEFQNVPYAVKGDQWVGFDDVDSITEKSKYALNHNLLGAMIWSIETEDIRGICGPRYPILTAVNDVLKDKFIRQ